MASENLSASVTNGIARPLADIAAEINRHHSEAVGHFRRSLEHARQAGELLRIAKAQIPHGGWLDWLAKNTELSKRTAQQYLLVAENWDAITTNAPDANLTIKQAVRSLAKPKAQPTALLTTDKGVSSIETKAPPEAHLATAQRSPAPEPTATVAEPQSAPDAWSERMEHLLKHDRREAARELGEELRRRIDYFREFIDMGERGLAHTGGDRWPDGLADSVRQGIILAKEMIEMGPFSDGFWLRYSMFLAIRNHVISTQAHKK